jgi:hypothetical protein
MSEDKNKLAVANKEVAANLNLAVMSVLGQEGLEGFERAFKIASAITQLTDLLTPEYMKPIMAMQGNKLGFKTDKDKTGGYPEAVVKNCLIEAVLMGLQPYGNQFNIISGQTYPTKEGCGYLLNNYAGLNYDIVCGLPRINESKTSASVEVKVTWSMNRGEVKEKTVPIPIKMDAYTSVDALIGKATRKARAWLLSTISGIEITDGEYTDAVVIEPINKETQRVTLMLEDCKSIADVENLQKQVINASQYTDLFTQKKEELKNVKG